MADDRFVNFKLDFDVKAIKAQIAKYFDDQYEEIHSLIESEVTPEKILLHLRDVVNRELATMIKIAVQQNVTESVRYNDDLTRMVSVEVSKLIKKKK